MEIKLRISLLLFSLFLIFLTTYILRKDYIPVKYSLIWYFAGFLIGFIALVPSVFMFFASIIGFELMSNLIIGVFIGILLLITLVLTIITARQKKKLILLIQEVSLLKEKVEK